MAYDLSIIIPSRNEMFLSKTIEDILDKSRANTQVIATLDGSWTEPPIQDHPKVVLIHYSEPVGQRKGMNSAAKLAEAKYIAKCDAHCGFDEGFDAKLLEDMRDGWTMVPVMRNLHAFDWVCENSHRFYQDKYRPEGGKCKECGKSVKIELVWKPRLHKKTDFMYMDKDLKVQYWYRYAKNIIEKGTPGDEIRDGLQWDNHQLAPLRSGIPHYPSMP